MEYQTENKQCHSEKIDEGRRIRRALRFKAHLRLHIETCGEQRKNIAGACDSDQPQLCRWENENYSGTLPSHLLPAWTRYVGPGLMAYLAREAGYDLVAGDDVDSIVEGVTAQSLGGISAALAVKHGKVLGLIIQVLEDGKVKPNEEQQLVEALPDIIALKHYIDELHDRVTSVATESRGKAVGE